MKTSLTSGSIVTGILTAFMTSLCCITPLFAVLAGATGFASTFSWLMPFKPYLIAISVFALSFAWYQKLRPANTNVHCNCEHQGRTSFIKSRKFLGVITVFAALMLSFSSYSSMFYPAKEQVGYPADGESIQLMIQVEGMSCAGCEGLIEHEVSKLDGIQFVQASFKNHNVSVEHNSLATDEEILVAIESLGYKAKIENFKSE